MPHGPILIGDAGAICDTIGAFLKRASHDVTIVDTVAEHLAAM
jgi:hypothetical protein